MMDLFEPDALAAAGTVIAGKGLPYPPMPAPPYRPARGPSWELRPALLPACAGYFNGPQMLSWTMFGLVRDGVTWMSTTPMEVESQQPHLAAATGTVVICGLGMGVMAYAVSALKRVRQVVVVERDPEVAAMFREFAAFDHWPQRRKIALVAADAREFRRADADFLYVDIWPYYRMDEMIPDMRAIHRNIPAPACGYWGQELDMVDAAAAQGVAAEDFSADHVRAFAAAHGLPLIGLEEPTYPQLCRRAATNPAIAPRRG